ncbi:MAG TPA: phosphoribosylformylglycinamidine synthase subunit PurL [Saprospiraceae bacterium]|nr:phosphoribosylformylglycinamidine synthase subunit PurL [Saprospiraceae bacterium]
METSIPVHNADESTALQLGLSPGEYVRICDILGRQPNFNELSIYSVMWSEHCSYKNSIKYLKTLPREGKRLLVGAGEENAGLVDIGGGLACAFKIESHNHPSAIEPYQGAATGVGGIHRDIFTMGARPIAALNSLRFGLPESSQMQHLIKGVVAGIGDYGNCLGVPTVGGEVYFDSSYRQNILVNAMSVGIVKIGETVSARADGPGNPVFIVGSATGRDGIHGATFASADLTEDSAEDLPAVQVGDPFQEKLLLEASLEAIKTGAMIGMQDMGAAGITCSTSEMTAKSGTGMRIDLDKVPTRQEHMEAWEILLSESQERMLIVAKKGKEHLLFKVFEKWDLECEQIGEVTDTGMLEYFQHGELIAAIPAHSLVLGGGAPVYDREIREPAYVKHIKAFDPASIPVDTDIVSITRRLISSPNIASKRWVYEQYDHTVRTNNLNTVSASDATVIRLKGTKKGIATTVDCNSRYVYADPYIGAMIAVAEAARNISCTGALPVAITNCLNFGNPYNPEVYWQFVNAVRGMGEACRKFDTPVTGGNVSFYNQSVFAESTEPVFPTPTIGMIGIMEDTSQLCTLGFKRKSDLIYLVGEVTDDLGCSEYLHQVKGVQYSRVPCFDLEKEYVLHQTIRHVIASGFVASAHDISEGGLMIALMESAFPLNLGFDIQIGNAIRKDAFLFGEGQGRAVISVHESLKVRFEAEFRSKKVPVVYLGQVTSGDIHVDGIPFGNIGKWIELYGNVLHTYLDN